MDKKTAVGCCPYDALSFKLKIENRNWIAPNELLPIIQLFGMEKKQQNKTEKRNMILKQWAINIRRMRTQWIREEGNNC